MAKCKKTISRKNLKKLAKELNYTARELNKIAGGIARGEFFDKQHRHPANDADFVRYI